MSLKQSSWQHRKLTDHAFIQSLRSTLTSSVTFVCAFAFSFSFSLSLSWAPLAPSASHVRDFISAKCHLNDGPLFCLCPGSIHAPAFLVHASQVGAGSEALCLPVCAWVCVCQWTSKQRTSENRRMDEWSQNLTERLSWAVDCLLPLSLSLSLDYNRVGELDAAGLCSTLPRSLLLLVEFPFEQRQKHSLARSLASSSHVTVFRWMSINWNGASGDRSRNFTTSLTSRSVLLNFHRLSCMISTTGVGKKVGEGTRKMPAPVRRGACNGGISWLDDPLSFTSLRAL